MPKRRKKSGKNVVSIIMITISLALVIAAMLLARYVNPDWWPGFSQVSNPTTESTESQSEATTFNDNQILMGITIGGIDVSGKTRQEVLAATSSLAQDFLARIKITVNVDGKIYQYTAKDLGLATDYDAVIEQALAYGHSGSAEQRKQAADHAKSAGVAFLLHASATNDSLIKALLPLKAEFELAPVDAAYTFMPWGYTADGKPFEPNVTKLADANSVGKNYSRPDLVRISQADIPNPLRYQYWQNSKYIPNYIPADANISRFLYTPESSGRTLNINLIASQISAQLKSGVFLAIPAASRTIEPAVKLADLKNGTQLIASWTSSYSDHYGENRNWNVSRMSSYINGCVIEPGQKWSVNKTAGPRTPETALTIGWRKAAGIENGGYTQQEGGGVCQLGSTTFNAAIRSGITIASSTHHTIPSGYIPLGLDATLSTPGPDLVLKNDSTKPFYLISYVNPKDKNVTVEVYGQPPVDPVYGSVIYDFTSDNLGTRYGEPTVRIIYNSTVALDETILDAEHPIYVYAEPRMGTEIQTYKHIYSLDGVELCDPIPYGHHKYPVINGTTYVFGPDPATITPTPSPTPPAPSPTLLPTPTPTLSPTPTP